MIGRHIPWIHSRAIAYLMCNLAFGAGRRKLKRQARREERRWLKVEICEQDA